MKSWPPASSALRKTRRRLCVAVWACAIGLTGGALRVCGQQTQPPTYAGFNGQNVSSVDIATHPGIDLEEMRQLIKQKVGAPFSEQAVRESVAALEQTKLFTEVQMSVEPVQSGLHVTFILQPADYVGVLQFPGLGPKFPYTALIQATDLPEQTPYVPGVENKARDGVLKYLQTRGYFNAEVTPEIERDEPHHIVNVVFNCVVGKQAKIRQIEFTGISQERTINAQRALRGWWARLKRVSLEPGQKYSRMRVMKSVPFIASHLHAHGQLEPSIRLADAKYDPDTNRVDVIFSVKPGARISVTVAGAKVSSKTLQRLVPVYQENSVDQELVDEGRRNLTAYFQTKGYFDATADSRIDHQADQVSVVYSLKLGSKHRLKRVNFQGNHHFSDKQLSVDVAIKKRLFFFTHGKYSQQLLNKSVSALTQAYKDAGFQNVSVQAKVDDQHRNLAVTFLIDEGPQDRVASLKLVGNKTQSLEALNHRYVLQLAPGKPFSRKFLETDRSQLLAAYLNLGYLNANVLSATAPTSDDPHKINVTFAISEGPRAYISDVVLLGERHTRAQYIEHTTTQLIRKGQPQSEGNFLQTESNLYDLGVFDYASVAPLRPIVDQTQEEVIVKVHESPLYSFDIGGGLEIIPRDGNIPVNTVAVPGLPTLSLKNNFRVSQKSYVGPRFDFDIVRHNLRGRAETATVGAVVSRLDQRVFLTYADPHLHGSAWSSLLSVSAERTTENPIFTAELGQASFQINKSLNRKQTAHLIGRYTFQRTDLYNILIPGLVLPQDQHVRLSSFDGEYIHDTRDKPLDAHHGLYQTADFGVTSTALGASADFFRFLGQSAFYLPVKPWLIWANNVRLGLAIPFSSSFVPLSERFFSGGADSLRGFPIDGAGPQRPLPVCSNPAVPSSCTLISVPVGGEMLFIVNSEARFPLPIYQNLGGVFFYDGGNVYANINVNQLFGSFTHTVGVGLRYNTPVGPIRFDFGYRLTNVPGVKATQYFVTLGQSF